MITARNYAQRIKRLQKKLAKSEIYLISAPSQIQYYTGFSFLVPQEREAFFICTKESANLVYSSFSPVENYEFINYFPGTYAEQFKKHFESILNETSLLTASPTVYYDAHTLFVIELSILSELQQTYNQINLLAFEQNPVSKLMMKKERQEIALLKQAAQITKEVLSQAQTELKEGVTELEIVEFIAEKLKAKNATTAFPTIVAFGANAAAPHHQPSNTKIEENMPVLIDMGAKYKSYCSDMTRTIWFGPSPSKNFTKVKKTVTSAYKAAFKTISQRKNQVTGKQVDAAARAVISNEGYGDAFIHTTGHGLGLEIHEQPSISWSNKANLEPQFVFTIEPGIYIEGELGYRHENTILVTQDGAEEITT